MALENRIIQLETVIVEENLLVITSSGTCYSNEPRVVIADPKDLLNRYTKIVKDARAKGFKISYRNRFKARLTALAEVVPAKTEEYEKLYEEHMQFWVKELNGGKTFTLDQVQTFSKGYELRNKMWSMFYRSQPLSELQEMASNIAELERNLEHTESGHGCTISL